MAQKIVTMHLNDNQIEWEFLVSARITSLGAISYEEPENIALFLFPAPQLSGLLDVEQLRAQDGAAAQSCIYDANLAGGQKPTWRGQNGVKTRGWREAEPTPLSSPAKALSDLSSENSKNVLIRAPESEPSYRRPKANRSMIPPSC